MISLRDMDYPHPKKIFVEKDVIKSSITQRALNQYPDVPIEYIDDYRHIRIEGDDTDNVFKESKECLAIATKKGDLVKEFRCRDGIIGSNEYYIIHGNNCHFDCEYCFLQSYFENTVPTLFVNHDEILDEIKNTILGSGNKKIVFHAGELCDALAFDNLTNLSHKLIKLFSEYHNARLELRTKTTNVENIIKTSGTDNVVISWTFSPQAVIDAHEHKTPSLDDRIKAAEEVQKAGYNVGICLDPIIRCDNWLDNYKNTIDLLFNRLDHSKIKFISLGGFRFLTPLANVIRERNSQTNLLLDEFVPCVDGKYRYFRPIRVELYRKLIDIIKQRCNDAKMFLCMETPEVWDEVGNLN